MAARKGCGKDGAPVRVALLVAPLKRCPNTNLVFCPIRVRDCAGRVHRSFVGKIGVHFRPATCGRLRMTAGFFVRVASVDLCAAVCSSPKAILVSGFLCERSWLPDTSLALWCFAAARLVRPPNLS